MVVCRSLSACNKSAWPLDSRQAKPKRVHTFRVIFCWLIYQLKPKLIHSFIRSFIQYQSSPTHANIFPARLVYISNLRQYAEIERESENPANWRKASHRLLAIGDSQSPIASFRAQRGHFRNFSVIISEWQLNNIGGWSLGSTAVLHETSVERKRLASRLLNLIVNVRLESPWLSRGRLKGFSCKAWLTWC